MLSPQCIMFVKMSMTRQCGNRHAKWPNLGNPRTQADAGDMILDIALVRNCCWLLS